MQQGTGFEQALELNQAAPGWFGAGDVLHPREQLGKGITVRTLGGTKDYFIRVVETEGDGVAILKLAAIDFFSIDEEAAALAAILDIEAIGFDDHGRAVAGDAAVGELQVVAGLHAAADHKRRLRDTGVASRAVRRDDFENGFTGKRYSVGHG